MEIERKFLVNQIPKNIFINNTLKIWQSYLATGDEEVRIRKVESIDGAYYTMCIKKGVGLKRDELEFEISKNTYMQLSLTKPIEKTRREFVFGGHIYQLDTYHNKNLSGLVIAEVEFKSTKDALNFKPPSWLGKDVTEDSNYKNQSLWIKCYDFTVDKYIN